ncbi:SAM-dependent methyltransferase [Thioalkalivibrio denitrificans]|uniref:SAM-dependent methyltransferase n=1 Tax=Thioalkalivibrio denitrificans TaxID=108003 RepID=A0A1V3NQ87_9GAMM|nr:class I SAM-dependent methyltransferase [Thioalkalivibrio denitrificans]OOG27201.1 SAM-dependent methyltransferase [Thioalkalivibrio denitrificans]
MTAEATAPVTPEEIKALKTRLKATWEAGDYGYFARHLEPGALEFLERLPIERGTRMLDVACGAGQISIPAARTGAIVTGVDLASNLVDQARSRARSENLDIRFEEGDAESLPYEDETFDLVVSLIGAMFAPRPDRVAAELVRVCRRGGTIVMANWTPESFVGQMFKTVGKHVPPPPGMASPLLWGNEDTVKERLGSQVSQLRITRRRYPFNYPFPPAEVVEHFRQYYGPVNRAFASLDEQGQDNLRTDLEALWEHHNESTDGTTSCRPEYIEVHGVR